MRDSDKRTLLRFGTVIRLHSLSIEAPTRPLKKWGCGRLAILAKREFPRKAWLESEVLEALFLGLWDVQRKQEFEELSVDALEAMTTTTNDDRTKVSKVDDVLRDEGEVDREIFARALSKNFTRRQVVEADLATSPDTPSFRDCEKDNIHEANHGVDEVACPNGRARGRLRPTA